MMDKPALPTPTLALEQTCPADLLGYGRTFDYLASSPKRLGLCITVERHPNTPLQAREISTELLDSAEPQIALTHEEAKYVHERLGTMLVRWPFRTMFSREHGQRHINQSDTSRKLTPKVAFLAAHWLGNPALSERIMPESTTKLLNQGRRLACLQYALKGMYIQDAVDGLGSRDPGMDYATTQAHLRALLRDQLIERSPQGIHALFTVSESVKPYVTDLLTGLHNVRNDTYATALRRETLGQITTKTDLYGRIAHGAIVGVLNTERRIRS
ncbi:MAG TPA: hypothetical protein VLE73_03785 [Candidatus Saccharimonadales bacterium]|nr:hypothetical protein [Candidatus Saccharimonadales bacterium]